MEELLCIGPSLGDPGGVKVEFSAVFSLSEVDFSFAMMTVGGDEDSTGSDGGDGAGAAIVFQFGGCWAAFR